jgi:hypothetical protein
MGTLLIPSGFIPSEITDEALVLFSEQPGVKTLTFGGK